MRKMSLIKRFIMAFLLVAASAGIMFLDLGTTVSASGATTTTMTLDYKGHMSATQDAYIPMVTYKEFHLKEPKDIIISDNLVYVADSGNARIVIIDSITGTIVDTISSFPIVDTNFNPSDVSAKNVLENVDIIGEYVFSYPSGISVASTGDIYVADGGSEAIFALRKVAGKWQCQLVILKPNSYLYQGASDFKVEKVAASVREKDGVTSGSIYALASGISEGVLQFDGQGKFIKFFAVNKVTMTFQDYIDDFLYDEEYKRSHNMLRYPPTISNLYVDDSGLLFTTTVTEEDHAYVKKLNTAGANTFTKYPLYASKTMEDIYTDKNGMVYAIDKGGEIFVYSPYGEFIHKFGGGGTKMPDIVGIFTEPTAIAVDNDLNIWVVDSKKNLLQTFKPTEYATMIYSALSAYEVADFDLAIDIWSDVLKKNQMSNIAHNNIGLNYLGIHDYENAMYHLQIANNKADYSRAYWEVRNVWLSQSLGVIIIIAIALVAVWITIKEIDKRKLILDPVRNLTAKIKSNKIFHNYMYMFRIARHPEDGFYDLKCKKHGSLTGAWMILATLFITYMLYITSQGFIYQYTEIQDIDFVSVVFGFVIIVFAFILCNYLVTSITNGIGGIKEIFKLLMYSLAPLIVGMLSITILSHYLTQSEAFFLDLILYVTIAWSVILVLVGMQEVQGYDLKQLFASIVLTFLLLIVFILVVLIITVLSQELFNFIQTVLGEVKRNVVG